MLESSSPMTPSTGVAADASSTLRRGTATNSSRKGGGGGLESTRGSKSSGSFIAKARVIDVISHHNAAEEEANTQLKKEKEAAQVNAHLHEECSIAASEVVLAATEAWRLHWKRRKEILSAVMMSTDTTVNGGGSGGVVTGKRPVNETTTNESVLMFQTGDDEESDAPQAVDGDEVRTASKSKQTSSRVDEATAGLDAKEVDDDEDAAAAKESRQAAARKKRERRQQQREQHNTVTVNLLMEAHYCYHRWIQQQMELRARDLSALAILAPRPSTSPQQTNQSSSDHQGPLSPSQPTGKPHHNPPPLTPSQPQPHNPTMASFSTLPIASSSFYRPPAAAAASTSSGSHSGSGGSGGVNPFLASFSTVGGGKSVSAPSAGVSSTSRISDVPLPNNGSTLLEDPLSDAVVTHMHELAAALVARHESRFHGSSTLGNASATAGASLLQHAARRAAFAAAFKVGRGNGGSGGEEKAVAAASSEGSDGNGSDSQLQRATTAGYVNDGLVSIDPSNPNIAVLSRCRTKHVIDLEHGVLVRLWSDRRAARMFHRGFAALQEGKCFLAMPPAFAVPYSVLLKGSRNTAVSVTWLPPLDSSHVVQPPKVAANLTHFFRRAWRDLVYPNAPEDSRVANISLLTGADGVYYAFNAGVDDVHTSSTAGGIIVDDKAQRSPAGALTCVTSSTANNRRSNTKGGSTTGGQSAVTPKFQELDKTGSISPGGSFSGTMSSMLTPRTLGVFGTTVAVAQPAGSGKQQQSTNSNNNGSGHVVSPVLMDTRRPRVTQLSAHHYQQARQIFQRVSLQLRASYDTHLMYLSMISFLHGSLFSLAPTLPVEGGDGVGSSTPNAMASGLGSRQPSTAQPAADHFREGGPLAKAVHAVVEFAATLPKEETPLACMLYVLAGEIRRLSTVDYVKRMAKKVVNSTLFQPKLSHWSIDTRVMSDICALTVSHILEARDDPISLKKNLEMKRIANLAVSDICSVWGMNLADAQLRFGYVGALGLFEKSSFEITLVDYGSHVTPLLGVRPPKPLTDEQSLDERPIPTEVAEIAFGVLQPLLVGIDSRMMRKPGAPPGFYVPTPQPPHATSQRSMSMTTSMPALHSDSAPIAAGNSSRGGVSAAVGEGSARESRTPAAAALAALDRMDSAGCDFAAVPTMSNFEPADVEGNIAASMRDFQRLGIATAHGGPQPATRFTEQGGSSQQQPLLRPLRVVTSAPVNPMTDRDDGVASLMGLDRQGSASIQSSPTPRAAGGAAIGTWSSGGGSSHGHQQQGAPIGKGTSQTGGLAWFADALETKFIVPSQLLRLLPTWSVGADTSMQGSTSLPAIHGHRVVGSDVNELSHSSGAASSSLSESGKQLQHLLALQRRHFGHVKSATDILQPGDRVVDAIQLGGWSLCYLTPLLHDPKRGNFLFLTKLVRVLRQDASECGRLLAKALAVLLLVSVTPLNFYDTPLVKRVLEAGMDVIRGRCADPEILRSSLRFIESESTATHLNMIVEDMEKWLKQMETLVHLEPTVTSGPIAASSATFGVNSKPKRYFSTAAAKIDETSKSVTDDLTASPSVPVLTAADIAQRRRKYGVTKLQVTIYRYLMTTISDPVPQQSTMDEILSRPYVPPPPPPPVASASDGDNHLPDIHKKKKRHTDTEDDAKRASGEGSGASLSSSESSSSSNSLNDTTIHKEKNGGNDSSSRTRHRRHHRHRGSDQDPEAAAAAARRRREERHRRKRQRRSKFDAIFRAVTLLREEERVRKELETLEMNHMYNLQVRFDDGLLRIRRRLLLRKRMGIFGIGEEDEFWSESDTDSERPTSRDGISPTQGGGSRQGKRRRRGSGEASAIPGSSVDDDASSPAAAGTGPKSEADAAALRREKIRAAKELKRRREDKVQRRATHGRNARYKKLMQDSFPEGFEDLTKAPCWPNRQVVHVRTVMAAFAVHDDERRLRAAILLDEFETFSLLSIAFDTELWKL